MNHIQPTRTGIPGCLVLASLLLTACGNSSPPAGTPRPAAGSEPRTRYDLANGCYALKSVPQNAYAVKDSSGGYKASSPNTAGAEPFYLKPAALGKYFFYAKDKSFCAVNGGAVGSATTPSDAIVWTIDTDAKGNFTLTSASAGKALATDAGGQLVLADAPGAFSFVPTSGCTPYPEMPVDVEGETYKGRGVDKPVIGFADGHTHMMMSNELSDGSGNIGPSAGGVLYGQMFNRFGAPEALKNCEAAHGPNGVGDPNTILVGSPSPHDTQGWPTFVDWPSATSETHQTMYYKWVERAWKSGLRLVVNLGTNISALCEVGRNAVGQPNADCDDMSLGVKQLHYLYNLQDYVDAQEGGPGKGWFRIVKSPAEARAVINDGKLAVVPGVEFANLFNCKVVFNPDGSESDGCDKAEIDRQIDLLYELGVRQLYPFHDVNSALGGTGIFTPYSLNLVGFYGTHQFWKTYDCPDTGQGDKYFYNAGAFLEAIPGTGNDPVTSALISAAQGTAPTYPADRRQCNARGMTDLGRYAVQQIMKKKIVIDIDHAELKIKQEIIDMAKAQNPPYPLVSMHGGHGGISLQQAKDVLNLGGTIFPYKPNGRGQAEFVQKVKAIRNPNFVFGVGYGFDGNGFGGGAGPRGAGSVAVKYPFTLFQGPGWGPQFAAAGIKPVTVNLLTIPESGKSWNVDEVGTAHYGLVPDFVEETRIEGGQEAIDALYNSAEAYLQMWERAVNR